MGGVRGVLGSSVGLVVIIMNMKGGEEVYVHCPKDGSSQMSGKKM
jgi:hypothetical protein